MTILYCEHLACIKVPVNLTRLKMEVSKKRKLRHTPKLMDLIAAVPEDYRDKILPYIKSKPVRTASGRTTPGFSYHLHRQ